MILQQFGQPAGINLIVQVVGVVIVVCLLYTFEILRVVMRQGERAEDEHERHEQHSKYIFGDSHDRSVSGFVLRSLLPFSSNLVYTQTATVCQVCFAVWPSG